MSEISRRRIHDELQQVCAMHAVKSLFCVEAGSRAWGFDSADSDYDVRFVYLRPAQWYLSIAERRDVLEPRLPEPLDLTGWDLQKALYQLYRGNPAFFEWLYSPVQYSVTATPRSDYVSELRELASKYFNPRSAIYHYLHMAAGNYHRYIRGNAMPLYKKYLYVVRPLLCCEYIETNHAMPPIGVDKLVAATSEPQEFNDLVAAKRAGRELSEGAALHTLNEWIDSRLDHFSKAARTTAKGSLLPDDLNEYFAQAVLRQ